MGVSRAHGRVTLVFKTTCSIYGKRGNELQVQSLAIPLSLLLTREKKNKKHRIIRGLRLAIRMGTSTITEGTPPAHRTTSDLLCYFLLLDSGSKNGKRYQRFPSLLSVSFGPHATDMAQLNTDVQ